MRINLRVFINAYRNLEEFGRLQHMPHRITSIKFRTNQTVRLLHFSTDDVDDDDADDDDDDDDLYLLPLR